MDIKGKAAIVTGSATGVGAAIARALAASGCNVAINYSRSEAEAQETAAACAALGADTLCVRADISDDGDCRALARAAVDKWGRLDVLVNNAGRTRPASPTDLDALNAEDFHHVYALNVVGTYQMVRAAHPHLKASGNAAILNVSALGALNGEGSSVAYSASKGALNAMTIFLARNFAPEIRVNAICPGFIQTRWMRDMLGEERFDWRVRQMSSQTPVRKAATADEVAEVAMWFVTGPDLITGEVLPIDYGTRFGLHEAPKG